MIKYFASIAILATLMGAVVAAQQVTVTIGDLSSASNSWPFN